MGREHVLIVSKSSDWHTDQPDWDFGIECTTPRECNGWIECMEDHAGLNPNDEDSPAYDHDDFTIHGEPHQWQYGYGWCITYGGCIVQWDGESWQDSAWDIAREHGEGRYVVDDEWGDFGCYLLLAHREGVTNE